METLSNFLKFSSPIDWLVVFFSVIVIFIGFVLLTVLRSRKLFYPFLVIALLPLLLGLATTYLKNRQIDRIAAMAESIGAEAVAAGREEAWVITYIGATASGAAILIGLSGLALKKGGKT